MPYIVCDPVFETEEIAKPTKYVITIDGAASFEVDPQDMGNGSVRLHYDVSGLTMGKHNIAVASKNLEGASSPVPFMYLKAIPMAPTNIRLEA